MASSGVNVKHTAHLLFEHAIAEFDAVRVIVTPRIATLPAQFGEAAAVILDLEPKNVGTGFVVDDDGFKTTMSFEARRFDVVVPWRAIIEMYTPASHTRFAIVAESASEKPKLKLVKG